jgi:hypothetical protein
MKIINLEKLDTTKTIVLTGRPNNVRKIAKHLKAKLYILPSEEDYFIDYPDIISKFKEHLTNEKGTIIVTTQSKEFLDCLLESELDFVQVTVRHYDHDDDDTYRIRVLTKEDAWADRCAFNMELRR